MGNIKGITIEIGSDTKKFKSGLKDLSQSSKDLQRELTAVNKALKHDPKNTDLLRQKQELLTKSVSETKSKLDALKAAKDRADKDMASGTEVNQEQYRRLVREISTTENSLKNLTREMKNFGSVSAQEIAAAGQKMQDVGGKLESVGKKMMPVSAAVTGLGVVAVKTAADFDSSMSQVAAVSGASGDDLERLRDKAREMGAQTKFSASEAADAMNYMAMAGWKTEDMLGGVEGIMNLAAASGEDLAAVSDIVTDGLTAFGLSAQDSGRMADVMAAASSNANTNVSMLGESYKYCASTAGAMGYSLEDVTESLGLMANAGVKGSQAGNTLKNAMINLAKPTDAMAAAMEQYNISITNTDGSMKSWNEVVANLRASLGGLSEAEQTAAVATLFGKEATAGMLSVINAAPADIEKLNGAILNSSGSAKEMAETMQDNLNGQLKELQSQLSELAISIGEVLMPVIRSIVQHLKGLVEKFNSLSDGQKKVIVVVGLLVAAIGPVILIIGKFASAIGAIMAIAPAITAALTAIKIAFAAIGGPVTIIIALIAGLVAKLIHAYNTSEDFRNKVNAAFAGVKNAVTGALSAAAAKVKEFVNVGKNVIVGLWNGINDKVAWLKGKVKGVVDKIKGWFTSKEGFDEHSPSKWSEGVGSYVMDGLGNGFEKDETAIRAARKAANNIKNAITDEISKVNDQISEMLMESEEKQAKEELKHYKENLAKKQAELKKAEPKNRQAILDEIAKIEKDWNKKQLEAAKQAEQKKLQERLTALQEFKQKYEADLAAIEQKETSLSDKLADYGELFSRVQDEDSGKEIFKLNDLDESIKKIEKYNAQIESLKEKGLDGGLLAEVANMNIDDALDFTAKLDSLSVGEFESYVEKFEEKRRLANEVAKQFYSDEMEELAMNAVEQAKGYADDFNDVGKALTDGVAEGIKDGKSSIVNAITKAIRDAIRAAKDEAGMGDGGSDGSHRTGLREVPFDGYRAILHKGERVLTQPEADRYRKGETVAKTENFNVYIGMVENKDERTTNDFMREMEFYRKRRVSAVGGAV
nr:phage tail tape measure protein [uncultured Anaerotignum sp.]